jgi:hypothetical protein
MANALGTLFKDVADAIRAKTGDTGTMKPAQFPEKIASITGGGGGVQLYPPTLSRSGETLNIDMNKTQNGSFVKGVRIYDNGELVGTYASETSTMIASLPVGTHMLTAEAFGDNVLPSVKSNALNASKYTVSLTLSNVTASTVPSYVIHGDSLPIMLTPASGYALPATITATMGGSSSGITYDADNKRIVINSVTGEVVISITAIKPVTLEETPWDKIADYAEDGSISSRFKLGDTKNLTVTFRNQTQSSKNNYTDVTFTYTMEIVGFNHDDLSSGDGKAGVTFMAKNRYSDWYVWRGGTYGSDGCWQSAWLRTSLNDVTKNSMPAELSSRLKQVKKTCDLGTTSIETSDYLWIPSLQEVGGTTSETVREHGTKYANITLSIGGTNYVTRNQPQTNNGDQYNRKQIEADGTVLNSSDNKTTVRWGFCL